MPKTTHHPARFITVPRAAEILGVSPRTVTRLIDGGELEAIRPSRQLRVSLDSVKRRMEGTREGPAVADGPVLEDLLSR